MCDAYVIRSGFRGMHDGHAPSSCGHKNSLYPIFMMKNAVAYFYRIFNLTFIVENTTYNLFSKKKKSR